MAGLDRVLPAGWPRRNPVNIQADATPERYAEALELAIGDTNTDGVLVILTPRTATDPTRTAEALRGVAALGRKPVLASCKNCIHQLPSRVSAHWRFRLNHQALNHH